MNHCHKQFSVLLPTLQLAKHHIPTPNPSCSENTSMGSLGVGASLVPWLTSLGPYSRPHNALPESTNLM